MRKEMIENAAYEVATQVRAVEDSIEAALARNGGTSGADGSGTRRDSRGVICRRATKRSSSSPHR